jgi:hypothetical protein
MIELSEDGALQHLESFAKRQLHHLYMTETANIDSLYFDVLNLPFSIGRRKIFQLSSAPWHTICASSDTPCAITLTAEEERECLRLDESEQDAEEQLRASEAMLGLGPEGWVSHDNYEPAQAAIARMKEVCLEQAESEYEKTVIKDHWIYDDMDEDEYL